MHFKIHRLKLKGLLKRKARQPEGPSSSAPSGSPGSASSAQTAAEGRSVLGLAKGSAAPASQGPHDSAPRAQSPAVTGSSGQWYQDLDRTSQRLLAAVCPGFNPSHSSVTLTESSKLHKRIEQHLAAREVHKAVTKLGRLIVLQFQQLGPEHPDSFKSVHTISQLLAQQDQPSDLAYEWLLSRVHHLDEAATRQLVYQAAERLCRCHDPDEHTAYGRLITEVAQQLPGGLGWGSTVVAPVPDEVEYAMYVAMSAAAVEAKNKGHYKLAQDFLQRCVAYFDTLGQHWLGMARKVYCMQLLSESTVGPDGPEAALAIMHKAKRIAQRELGPSHELTLDMAQACALYLGMLRRLEQALSMCLVSLKRSEAAFGPDHYRTLLGQVSLSQLLLDLGKRNEAKSTIRTVLDRATLVSGMEGDLAMCARIAYRRVIGRDV